MLSQGFTQLQTQKLNLTQSLAQSIQLLQFDIEELDKYLDEAALDNPFLVVRRRTYPVAAKNDFFEQLPEPQKYSLVDYVQEQIIMNWHDTRLRKMLMTLSESLDEKGYLTGKPTELLKEYRPTKIEIADCLTLFKVIRIFKPNLQDCRDMTLFKDKDKAYLIASSDGNKTLRVTELTADYTNVTRNSYKLFIDQEREAPTIFHTKDWYFMITSGCTGWSPNPALYSRSHALLTGQKLINNPCVGPESDKTFLGQPTYIFEVNGNFYLMLDHWKKDNLRDSGYSILPIKIEGRDLRIDWSEELPKF